MRVQNYLIFSGLKKYLKKQCNVDFLCFMKFLLLTKKSGNNLEKKTQKSNPAKND